MGFGKPCIWISSPKKDSSECAEVPGRWELENSKNRHRTRSLLNQKLDNRRRTRFAEEMDGTQYFLKIRIWLQAVHFFKMRLVEPNIPKYMPFTISKQVDRFLVSNSTFPPRFLPLPVSTTTQPAAQTVPSFSTLASSYLPFAGLTVNYNLLPTPSWKTSVTSFKSDNQPF